METVANILFYLGIVVAMVGNLWLLVLAFRQNIWWGLASLIIPFVIFVFVIQYWGNRVKTPFFIALTGIIMYIAASLLLAL
jgi:uncharacterized membrane protein